jgi:tetratricopeptide (TPR) repeat protein
VDPGIAAAARALTHADPLGALRHVALRKDPPALAIHGIALAQLGDFPSARRLLVRAARGFRASDPAAHARCLAAEAEIALECRDLDAARKSLTAALAVLERARDRENAWFCRLQLVRLLVLLGRLDQAEAALAQLDRRGLPDRMRALLSLLAADVAMRGLRPSDARGALARAHVAAESSGIASLVDDATRKLRELDAPVGRLFSKGVERAVTLDDVAALSDSSDVLVDMARREARRRARIVSLARRPVLLNLAAALGEGSPGDVDRETLIRRAFGTFGASESLRARLRVEIGRLRRALAPLCDVRATTRGFVMAPRSSGAVLVLHPPELGDAGIVLALLSSGASWSASAIAQVVGASQRTVQRVLADLEAGGRVRGVGAGRARKWIGGGLPGFATSLLLVPRGAQR